MNKDMSPALKALRQAKEDMANADMAKRITDSVIKRLMENPKKKTSWFDQFVEKKNKGIL